MAYSGVERNINAYGRFEDGQGRTLLRLFNNRGSDDAAGAVARMTWPKSSGKNGRDCAIAISTTTSDRQKIVVAAEAVTDQTWGMYYVDGPGITATVPSATYTAGDGLVVDNSDGKIMGKTGAVDLTDLGFFASIEVGGTTVTSITIRLIERESVVQA